MADFGPREPSFSTLALRLLGALAGSTIGALCMFGIFVLSSGFSTTESVRVLSIFVLLMLVIVGSMVTNLVTTFFITYFDREIYSRYSTILTQSFIVQLTLFIFTIPAYIIINSLPLGGETVGYFAAFHFFITVIVSALIMEILSESQYKIVSVYGIALSSVCSFGVILAMHLSGLGNFVFFIIAPLLWATTELFRSLVDFVYFYFYKFYGIDALNEETKLDEEDL